MNISVTSTIQKKKWVMAAVKFNLASAAADDIYLSLVQDSVIAGS